MRVTTIDMAELGLAEIQGADVIGGEDAFWPQVGIGILIAIGAAIIRDWDDFKSGLAEGYKAGASGTW